MESLKPDCSDASQRKRRESSPAELRATHSPVQFESKSCGIAPISCNFQSNLGGFLCTSDCVAEGETFEPSVQLVEAKARRVRRLRESATQSILRDCAVAALTHQNCY